MNITLEQLSNSFNLSDNLSVYKTVPRPFGGLYVILKKTSFKMYPAKSFGKKETSYLVYTVVMNAENNGIDTTYSLRLATVKEVNVFLGSLKKKVVD